jgi:uncharacterized protein DUF1844
MRKMSEDQSNFKVTDRRLFNSDGTPRDIEREEEHEIPAVDVVSESTSSAGAQGAAAQPAPQSTSGAEASATGGIGAATPESPGEYDEAEIPGAEDPSSFINFLMSIASNAAAALGMIEHPVTGERGVNLEVGKHWIDVLGMLQEKTRGNLQAQEQQIFEGLLADLRMQYVSLTQAAPRTPPGFTGRDIIGGK